MTTITGILNKQGRQVGFISNNKKYILYQYWKKVRGLYPDIRHTVICNSELELDKNRQLQSIVRAKRDITGS